MAGSQSLNCFSQLATKASSFCSVSSARVYLEIWHLIGGPWRSHGIQWESQATPFHFTSKLFLPSRIETCWNILKPSVAEIQSAYPCERPITISSHLSILAPSCWWHMLIPLESQWNPMWIPLGPMGHPHHLGHPMTHLFGHPWSLFLHNHWNQPCTVWLGSFYLHNYWTQPFTVGFGWGGWGGIILM